MGAEGAGGSAAVCQVQQDAGERSKGLGSGSGAGFGSGFGFGSFGWCAFVKGREYSVGRFC